MQYLLLVMPLIYISYVNEIMWIIRVSALPQ